MSSIPSPRTSTQPSTYHDTVGDNTMTRRVFPHTHHRRSQEKVPSNAKSTIEDDYTLSAYGDLSMSEAYNVPAPTTGDYPLKLKRTRPPKAKKPKKKVLSVTPDRSSSRLPGMKQLYRPPLNTPPLTPTSDFKRFVEELRSARAASQDQPDALETTDISASRHFCVDDLSSSRSRVPPPSCQ